MPVPLIVRPAVQPPIVEEVPPMVEVPAVGAVGAVVV